MRTARLLATAGLKEWLDTGKKDLSPRTAAFEQPTVDELHYIKNETAYISAVVDSTQGLLKPADVERVIALTRVLKRINGHMFRSCR